VDCFCNNESISMSYVGIGNIIMRCGGGGVTIAAPSGLTVTLIAGGVQLNWTSTGIIEIWVSTGGGAYILLATTAADVITYTDGLTDIFPASYKIRVKSGTNYSAYSNVAVQTLDLDAQFIFDRIVAAGETISAPQQTNVDTLIKYLKTNNLYSRFDQFVIPFAGVASSKLNLINQYSTPTFATKLTGNTSETGHPGTKEEGVFYSIGELSNGDLLAGVGVYSGHYYKSTDKGETWVDQGALAANANSVYTFCESIAGTVVAGVNCTGNEGHIFISTNFGAAGSWSDLGRMFLHDYIPIIKKGTNGTLIATTEKSPTPSVAHILRSVDGGHNWTDEGNGSTDMTVINCLEYFGSGVWVAGGGKDNGSGVFTNGRLIRSTDDGDSWTDLGVLVTGEKRYFGSINLGGGIGLVSSSPLNHILRTTDSGATWTDLGAMFTENLTSGFVNYGYGKVSGVTGAGTYSGLIIRSDDYGKSWQNDGVLSAGYGGTVPILIGDGSVLIPTSTDGTIAAKIFKMTSGAFVRKTANSYNMTGVANGGTLTFTTKQGFSTDGTNSYLNSNFIANAAIKYKLNDCSYGWLISGTLGVAGSAYYGGQNIGGARLIIMGTNYGTAAALTYLNSDTAGTGSIVHAIGYNCLSRDNSATYNQYVNAGVAVVTANASLPLDNDELFELCYNESDVPKIFERSTVIWRAGWKGASLTQAEFILLQTGLNAYIAAL
jgi:hypothetical protein